MNLIVENLANVNLGKDLPLLARYGRVAIVGNRGTVEINPRDLMTREAEVFGVFLGFASERESQLAADAVDKGIEDGSIKPAIDRVYPLDQAPQAHDCKP